jgi:ABC-2 type transport system ATP-binding protein
VAYFAGEGTLPGTVRASVWGRLAHGALAIRERRRIRTLSRGTRQLLGLRTVLGRHPLGLIALDEPWESLDADGVRWLSNTLATKRDRGAAIVLASQRVHDLAAMCDAYLFLLPHGSVLVRSHEIAPGAVVTAERLTALAERVRAGASLRAVS